MLTTHYINISWFSFLLEMSASVEFHLGAILENESLQLALRGLLNEENSKGIKEVLEYVRQWLPIVPLLISNGDLSN